MELTKLEIESDLFKRNVFQLEDIIEGNEFTLLEKSIIKAYNPYYLQCIAESSDIKLIHSLEDAGFRFIEFRVIKTLEAHDFANVGYNAFYPYQLHLITEKSSLAKAEQLLFDKYSDDRFAKDPLIKNNISKARIVSYLHKSFSNQSNEFIYGLINYNTGELVAFKSGEIISKNEALFYLTGAVKNSEHSKYCNILETLLISALLAKGVIRIHAITSGFNVPELNLSTHDLNYKIKSTKVILRKLY